MNPLTALISAVEQGDSQRAQDSYAAIATSAPELAAPALRFLVESPKAEHFYAIRMRLISLTPETEILGLLEDSARSGRLGMLLELNCFHQMALEILPLPASLLADAFAIPESNLYANMAWRDAVDEEVDRLLSLRRQADNVMLRPIVARLLETRHARALAAEPHKWPHDSKFFPRSLNDIGFDETGGVLRELYASLPRHLIFPKSHLPDFSLNRQGVFHPTWRLPSNGGARFGGVSGGVCASCGERLHHLVTLDPMIEGLGVSLARLELATCISCLGWEENWLSFKHDDSGTPEPYGVEGGRRSPQWPSAPIKETTVGIAATPRRWKWQEWGQDSNLHRVGGHPSWIQVPDYPLCPETHRPMRFLMQLDSFLPLENGKEVLWGSGGGLYVFWSDEARISTMMWQCT